MSSLNLNNIYVGENGRVQLSGGSSNIDFVDTVDQMIAARRIPADSLEKRIEKNDQKLVALKELQTLLGELKDSMANLYGATSFDNSKNIFESKQIFASSNGTDAASLIGVAASNAAATGSYTFEVDQIATKNKISIDTQPVAANADVTGITGTGTFTITGGAGSASVSVNAGDTLQDIRDKINNIKESTGVQASVVKVSDTESTLIFTSTEEGTANQMSFSDDTGTVLQSLGLLTDATTINAANVIDEGFDAQIQLDGITVTRGSNEFSDLIDGLTISLYDAEPGTEITIEIEQDLNQAKTAILDFIDAYNAVQSFVNENTFVDPATGEASEDSILLGNSTVKSVEATLQQIAGSIANGVSNNPARDNYSILAEIGIDFVGYGTNQDPLLDKTLELDEVALNEALLNEPTEVMELFLFRSKSDNSDLTMTGFNSSTSAGEYVFNIDASGGAINAVTYDLYDTAGNVVATGQSATVNGNSITTPDGLRMFYNGDGAAADTVNVTTSIGIGAQFYFGLDDLLNDESGLITQEISSLETQNTSYEEKVERIDTRLAKQKEILMDKFILMESALARMKNIQSSLDELMAAGKESS